MSTQLITLIKEILPVITIIAQLIIVAILLSRFVFTEHPLAKRLVDFVSRYGITLAFVVVMTAMSGSLFYSEILGYAPCKLCWYQRIFMYSQVPLFAAALLWKDESIRRYGILLSTLGGIIALNHYLLQWIGISILPCSAVGYSVSCTKEFVMEYGYVTIPVMALTAFATVITFLWIKNAKN